MSPSVSLVLLSVRKDWLLVNLLSRSASQVLYFKRENITSDCLTYGWFLWSVSCPLCRRYRDSQFVLRNPSDSSLVTNQFGLQALFLTTRYFYILPFTTRPPNKLRTNENYMSIRQLHEPCNGVQLIITTM